MKKKPEQNLQKRRFPAFSAGKNFFSKIGLRHILGIIILRQCAKFHEKMSTKAKEIQEIPFFRKN